MSGPGSPSFLDHAAPYRDVYLKSLTPVDPEAVIYDDDEPAEGPYIKKVWARICAEGWTGWHYKQHMLHQPRVTWLGSQWEEVPACELRDGYWREIIDGPE